MAASERAERAAANAAANAAAALAGAMNASAFNSLAVGMGRPSNGLVSSATALECAGTIRLQRRAGDRWESVPPPSGNGVELWQVPGATPGLFAFLDTNPRQVLALSRGAWSPVTGAAEALLRAVGQPPSEREVAPRTLVGSGDQLRSVGATCSSTQGTWGGRPCTPRLVRTAEELPEGSLEDFPAALSRSGVAVYLRAHCEELGEVLGCPLEAVTLGAGAPRVRELGFLHANSYEGNSAPGSAMLTAEGERFAAAWIEGHPRGGMRNEARVALSEGGGAWRSLPVVAQANEEEGRQPRSIVALSVAPLAVLWAEEPSTDALAVWSGSRWERRPLPTGDFVALGHVEGQLAMLTSAEGATALHVLGASGWQSAPVPR